MSRLVLAEVSDELARQKQLKADGKFAETAEDKAARGDLLGAWGILSEEVLEFNRALNDNEPCSRLLSPADDQGQSRALLASYSRRERFDQLSA